MALLSMLRSRMAVLEQQELARVSGQLRNLSEQERATVESLTQRLIDEVFHHLLVRLEVAAQTDPKLVEAAEFFFLPTESGFPEHPARHRRERAS